MHAVRYVLDSVSGFRDTQSLHDNVFWPGAAARISVCLPICRHDISPLLTALAACTASGLIEIIVYDDGSRDHALLASMEAVAGQTRAAVRIVSAHASLGRAAARNAAIAHARADWILLLEPDTQLETKGFVEAYLDAIDRMDQPALIAGGCFLASAPKDRAFALDRWQAKASEGGSSSIRRRSPGQPVRSSNLLVHRAVLQACRFDESLGGWGWDDVDWWLRVQKQFAVVHIDNRATRLDFDTTDALMEKYARSADNFARLLAHRRDDVAALPVYRRAKRLRALPFQKSLKALAGKVARSESLPLILRGPALRIWQALVCADVL
jgi:glycosyltransferase involved in cell wall biosynthesis